MRMLGYLVRGVAALLLWSYVLGLLGYLILRLVIGDGYWLLVWLNNFTPYYFLPLVVALPLALLLKLRYLKIITGTLLALGALWIVPRFIPDNWNTAHTPADYAVTLKVVTFNVWGDNIRLEEVLSWLRETNADLVLLQDVPAIWSNAGLAPLADLYPYQVHHTGAEWVHDNALLSKYPLSAHVRYDLGDAVSDRVVVNVGGNPVAVYNLHLPRPLRELQRISLPFNRPFLNMLLRYDDRARNLQIDRLLAILQDETHPYIVGGDFNMSANTVKYSEIASQLHDSFAGAGMGIGATWPNAEIAGLPRFVPPLIRIDYLWHSDALIALRAETGPILGSDHLPVIATLGLAQPPRD